MTACCQVTELPFKDLPELPYFYQYSAEHYPFFLSSTSQLTPVDTAIHHSDSNFDILFIRPEQWLMLDNNNNLSASEELDIAQEGTFLDSLDKLYQDAASEGPCEYNFLPFRGGWFVFLSYELAQEVEPVLKPFMSAYQTRQTLPLAYAARVRQALIIDHQQEQVFFITEQGIDHALACQILKSDIKNIRKQTKSSCQLNNLLVNLQEEVELQFLNSVEQVRDYVREGDVFQVNMSRLWQAKFNYSDHSDLAACLYKKLSKTNPAPFSGLAGFNTRQGQATIISSSPERLLSITNKRLQSRPIAGTHPRSTSDKEDRRLLERLHNHPKEQAEHIMLIDLIRNDLGRVCIPGSVAVDELMINESYAHVHHIVSNVVGELQKHKTPVDAIRALFPGGTITGCPKVRCMEIIAQLEHCPRGAYTGSMGYINLDGSMDLNILIRTMVLEERVLEEKVLEERVLEERISEKKLLGQTISHQGVTQKLSFRAGAGLVFDSLAEQELQETRAKAKGLLKALDIE